MTSITPEVFDAGTPAEKELLKRLVAMIPHPSVQTDISTEAVRNISEIVGEMLAVVNPGQIIRVCCILTDLLVLVKDIEAKYLLFERLVSIQKEVIASKIQRRLCKAAFALLHGEWFNDDNPASKKLGLELLAFLFKHNLEYFTFIVKKLVNQHANGKALCFEMYTGLHDIPLQPPHASSIALIEWCVNQSSSSSFILSLIKLLVKHTKIFDAMARPTRKAIFAEACHALKTFDNHEKFVILQFFSKIDKIYLQPEIQLMLENEQFSPKLQNEAERYTFSTKGALLACLENEQPQIRLGCLRLLSKFSLDKDFSVLVKLSKLFFYFYNDEDIRIRIFSMRIDLKMKKHALQQNVNIDAMEVKEKVYHYEYLAHDKSESIRSISYKLISLVKIDYEDSLPWFYKILEIFQNCLDQRKKGKDEVAKIKKSFFKFLQGNNLKLGKIFVDKQSNIVKNTLANAEESEKKNPTTTKAAILFFLENHSEVYILKGLGFSSEGRWAVGSFLNSFFGSLRKKTCVTQNSQKVPAKGPVRFFSESFTEFIADFEDDDFLSLGNTNYSEYILSMLKDVSTGLIKNFDQPLKKGDFEQFDYCLVTLAKKRLLFKLAFCALEFTPLSADVKSILSLMIKLLIALNVLKVTAAEFSPEKNPMSIYKEQVTKKLAGLITSGVVNEFKWIEETLSLTDTHSMYQSVSKSIEHIASRIRDAEPGIRKLVFRLRRCYLSLESSPKVFCRDDAYEIVTFKIQFRKGGQSRLPIKLMRRENDSQAQILDLELEEDNETPVTTFTQNERVFFDALADRTNAVTYTLVKALSGKVSYPVSNSVTIIFTNSARALSNV